MLGLSFSRIRTLPASNYFKEETYMAQPTELKDVAKGIVGTKVQQVIDADAGTVKVECVKQSDGKWTIRAS